MRLYSNNFSLRAIYIFIVLVLLTGCGNYSPQQADLNEAMPSDSATPLEVVMQSSSSTPFQLANTIEPLKEFTPTITPQSASSTPVEVLPETTSHVINQKDLKKFMPGKDDLPAVALYKLCKNCESRLQNEEIEWDWGKGIADKFISDTGRIRGWSAKYIRGSLEIYTPETLTIELHVFNTSSGATKAIMDYNPYKVFPDKGWLPVNRKIDLGDNYISVENNSFDIGGTETVEYQIWFSYHNLVGVVKATGWPEDIVPEIIEGCAQKLFDKMKSESIAPYSALTPIP